MICNCGWEFPPGTLSRYYPSPKQIPDWNRNRHFLCEKVCRICQCLKPDGKSLTDLHFCACAKRLCSYCIRPSHAHIPLQKNIFTPAIDPHGAIPILIDQHPQLRLHLFTSSGLSLPPFIHLIIMILQSCLPFFLEFRHLITNALQVAVLA